MYEVIIQANAFTIVELRTSPCENEGHGCSSNEMMDSYPVDNPGHRPRRKWGSQQVSLKLLYDLLLNYMKYNECYLLLSSCYWVQLLKLQEVLYHFFTLTVQINILNMRQSHNALQEVRSSSWNQSQTTSVTHLASYTIPSHSIQQSHITGPSEMLKCHGHHGHFCGELNSPGIHVIVIQMKTFHLWKIQFLRFWLKYISTNNMYELQWYRESLCMPCDLYFGI